MRLLDTNVLSALMQPSPPPAVIAWMAAQPAEMLFTAAPCQAEIRAGIAILPAGRRRDALATAAAAMFTEDFAERVLPFDSLAADTYADLFARRRQAGRPAALMDLMIAAIARVHDAGVVTRNVRDFADCGVAVIDPWQGP